MTRVVNPEILDSLPDNSPLAHRIRMDIARFNGLMGNFRWISRQFANIPLAKPRVLELAPGSGDLCSRLFPLRPQLQYLGVDLCRRPDKIPENAAWEQGNILHFTSPEPFDVVMGSLILHQFKDHEIRLIAERWSPGAKHLIFCEPARKGRFIIGACLSRLIGMHPISVRDAVTSIRAGFRKDELTRLLGISPDDWQIHIDESILGAYRFHATRRSNLTMR